ncbi:Histone-lysine N-methyltransferase PRDM9 [Orchesella cincta]|uniref:Histone-lysine N-methyltransferase PRDM9 n=1 Tax=Orchesella cincta TaxID=48709 RepID=A0A1D2MF16_ORCCI|nr:Histone-lysine N-methyltransferase PRDM9 [Orchesella cincta]
MVGCESRLNLTKPSSHIFTKPFHFTKTNKLAANFETSHDGRQSKISLPFQFQPKKEETNQGAPTVPHDFCKTGDTPFKCEVCGKGLIAKSHYEYHLRKHTGELPYVCKVCNRRFIAKGKLNRHMRSHTGEKRFVCQECNRGFTTSQALKTHTYIHTGERPFLCTKCPQQFTTLTNLKKHLVTHTGRCLSYSFTKTLFVALKLVNNLGDKDFLCNYCGKSFFHKDSLDVHLTTHSSTPRPHICGQCGRAFGSMKISIDIPDSYWLAASKTRFILVTNNDISPFLFRRTAIQCSICELKFSRQDNLTRHIGNVHKHLKGKSKRLRIKAKSQSIESTASQSSPIAEKRKTNEKRWKKLEDELEEKVYNLGLCGIMNPTLSLGKVASEKVDEEVNEDTESTHGHVVALPVPGRAMSACYMSAGAFNDENIALGFEAGDLENETGHSDYFSHCPIENDYDKLSGIDGRNNEAHEQKEENGQFETANEKEEEKTPDTFPFGTGTRLQHAAASLPSAEIETDIQLKRGPRKHFVSRYYFIHHSSGSALSPVKVISQNICEQVIEGVKAVAVPIKNVVNLEGKMDKEEKDDSTFNDDGRPILITADLLKAVENEMEEESLDLEIDKRKDDQMWNDATETHDTTTMTKTGLEEQNLIPEAHEQNESHKQFENNGTTIANEEETSAARFDSFNESASSQPTTVEAENQKKCGGAMKYVSHYYFDYEHPNFVIKKFKPDV